MNTQTNSHVHLCYMLGVENYLLPSAPIFSAFSVATDELGSGPFLLLLQAFLLKTFIPQLPRALRSLFGKKKQHEAYPITFSIFGEFAKFSLFQHSSWPCGHDCYLTRKDLPIHQFCQIIFGQFVGVFHILYVILFVVNLFDITSSAFVIGSISVHRSSFIKSDFRYFTHKFFQQQEKMQLFITNQSKFYQMEVSLSHVAGVRMQCSSYINSIK